MSVFSFRKPELTAIMRTLPLGEQFFPVLPEFFAGQGRFLYAPVYAENGSFGKVSTQKIMGSV
jgi:hypothetical protein